MTKLSIIYFYQYFGTPKGGWSTRAYEFARRWAAKGHTVTIVTSVYDKSDHRCKGFLSRQEIDGIDVVTVNVTLSNKHGFAYRLYTFAAYAMASSFIALTERYDVVLASSGPITVGFPALTGRYLKRKPLVFEVRDLWPEGAVQLGVLRRCWAQRLAYALERRCYRAATEIVTLSKDMTRSIEDRFRCMNVHTVPNAADVDLFQSARAFEPLPEPCRNKKLVLYTGSLGIMDDVGQILQAAGELKRRENDEVMLVIIGDGQERIRLETEARSMSLQNVIFLGLRPKIEVAQWLRRAVAALVVFKNVAVLDTCSPNKMFDAFAAGVPVIQTTQGWIKSLLSREACGITVLPNDPGSMADAIALVSSNQILREKLATNAGRVARSLFDRDQLAQQMLDIIITAA